MDRRAFGRVHFPRPSGRARLEMKTVQKAFQTCLGVRVRLKNDGWWFGPKVAVFEFMGEKVKLKRVGNGDGRLEIGHMDDEARETLLEYLRHSLDFEGR